MELAVTMGMDGAALPDPDPHFTEDEQAAIATIADENANGVTSQLITYWNRDYDNRTAAAGSETTLSIFDATIYAGLVRVKNWNIVAL